MQQPVTLDVGLALGLGHHDRLLPYDPHLLTVTAKRDQFAIERLALTDLQIERHIGAERHISDIRCGTDDAGRTTGLNQHRPTLRRWRRVQRPAHPEVSFSMLDRVHLCEGCCTRSQPTGSEHCGWYASDAASCAVAESEVNLSAGDPVDFVRAQTHLGQAPLVPEIGLHLASEITPIWQATEDWLAERNVEPPFWAFAWPGGQALARHILDHASLVTDRRVLDFAAGGGIAAIACARVGAALVEAAEIDAMARAAIALNAAANGVELVLPDTDVVGGDCRWDLILCGDVCYEAPMTAYILPWLRRMAGTAEVWVADPGRAYLPRDGLTAFASYRVPTSLELEDRTERQVTLYRLCG